MTVPRPTAGRPALCVLALLLLVPWAQAADKAVMNLVNRLWQGEPMHGQVCGTAADSEGKEQEAEQTVQAFEMPLVKQLLAQTVDEEEQTRRVRRFFAGLSDSQTRMAALGLIDNRYVSVVPQRLHEELLRPLLEDDDLTVRVRAAKAVAYLGSGAKHAEALIALLEQRDREAKTAALAAMGRSRAERFLPLVQKYLRDDQPELRTAAVWAMIRFPAARAGPLVEPLLEDANAEVRASAVQSLGVMGWTGGVRRIERLLADANPVVRQRAVQFLANHGDAHSPQALVEVLDDPHHHVRAHAAEALGRLEATEQAAHVRRMLKDEDVVVRRYAIVAVGRLRDHDSVTRLAELLDDEDPQVPVRAVEALAAIGDKSAADSVAQKFEAPSSDLRAAALLAAAQLGAAGHSETIARHLDDPEEQVRVAAIRALAILGSMKHLPALKQLSADPSQRIRDEAARAVERLKGAAKSGERSASEPVTKAAPDLDKPPAPSDYQGAWRMLLPAGFEHQVALEAAGENRYRLAAGGTRFNGIYEVREGRLVAVEPEETRVEGFQWQIRSPYMLTLVEQSKKPEHDYRGTVLFRPRPTVER